MIEAKERSRRIKIVGKLASAASDSRTIKIQLDTQQSVEGRLNDDAPLDASVLLGDRVMADALAYFGPAGELVRIEIESLQAAPEANSFFSRLPVAPLASNWRERLRVPQGPESGMNAIFGRWPGDESEEEILAALKELS